MDKPVPAVDFSDLLKVLREMGAMPPVEHVIRCKTCDQYYQLGHVLDPARLNQVLGTMEFFSFVLSLKNLQAWSGLPVVDGNEPLKGMFAFWDAHNGHRMVIAEELPE